MHFRVEGCRDGRATELGWRAARAPLVAFTDDDCRPAPDWLERMVAADRDRTRSWSAAPSRIPTSAPPLGLARTIDNPEPSGWYETSNIAYPEGSPRTGRRVRREHRLHRRGRRSRRCGRERARRLRHFVPDALVWHAVHWRNVADRACGCAKRRSLPRIVARHPELRKALWLGVFTDRITHGSCSPPPGSCSSGARHFWLRWPACPYVKSQVASGPWSAWRALRFTTRLLSRAVVDAAEAAILATSSLCYGTLVL